MNIRRKVVEIIAQQLNIDEEEVTLDSSLTEDLGADSLDTVEITMTFEDEFGIEIDDGEWEEMVRVRDAFELVERKVRAKPPTKDE